MEVGFTGTREGMSDAQKAEFHRWLIRLRIQVLHHGDCIGADEEVDKLARDHGVEIVIHPPLDPKARAYCAKPGDVVYEPAPYLQRNHDIVDFTKLLIAAPKTMVEELRSGTWATIRYAKKLDRRVIILER